MIILFVRQKDEKKNNRNWLFFVALKSIIMYEDYLNYHHIPCGAVIDRIRTKEHLTQRELAERSGILLGVYC